MLPAPRNMRCIAAQVVCSRKATITGTLMLEDWRQLMVLGRGRCPHRWAEAAVDLQLLATGTWCCGAGLVRATFPLSHAVMLVSHASSAQKIHLPASTAGSCWSHLD